MNTPSRSATACAFLIMLFVTACAQKPVKLGLMDVISRPAEQALLMGINAYENGQYADAESQLGLALQSKLVSPKDTAAAHKHLAFIYCSSKRPDDCAAAFRAARKADPQFALSRSEQGHPVWGQIYRQVQP